MKKQLKLDEEINYLFIDLGMKYVIFFFAVNLLFTGYGQDSIKLNRFFLDHVAFVGIEDVQGKTSKTPLPYGGWVKSNPSSIIGGYQFKMGNNWFIDKTKFKAFIRLTWFRIGGYYGASSGYVLTPLQIGLGKRLYISKKMSIEPILNVGPVILTDSFGILDDVEFIFNYAIVPEIKINFDGFTLGLEFSMRLYDDLPSTTRPGGLYYGSISFGKRFGG